MRSEKGNKEGNVGKIRNRKWKRKILGEFKRKSKVKFDGSEANLGNYEMGKETRLNLSEIWPLKGPQNPGYLYSFDQTTFRDLKNLP